MIGIFDSGRGGLASLAIVRRALLSVDIIYLADRKNAPYGTKGEAEILELVARNIYVLKQLGADEILMACSTASTVFDKLKNHERVGVFPIIERTADIAAGISTNGRVALVATEATVKSHAYDRALKKSGANLVLSLPLQSLVGMVERGVPRIEALGIIKSATEKIRECGADTLILGCTHFSYLQDMFMGELPYIKTVDCAAAGATLMIERNRGVRERGRVVYL